MRQTEKPAEEAVCLGQEDLNLLFTDSDGNWDSSKPNSELGYVQPHWWLTEYPESSDFAHYHIDFGGKTGTEGYHIHLWKPEGRPRWNRPWVAQAKSPKSDEWVEFRNSVKGNLTPVLLNWYNTDIAEPEKVEATGFAQYLIQTGAGARWRSIKPTVSTPD